VICTRMDSLNDLMIFRSIVEHTLELYGENFGCVLMNMRICCYDLVSVDSKTLVHFLLSCFTLLYLVYVFFFIIKNQNILIFGTRLGFD